MPRSAEQNEREVPAGAFPFLSFFPQVQLGAYKVCPPFNLCFLIIFSFALQYKVEQISFEILLTWQQLTLAVSETQRVCKKGSVSRPLGTLHHLRKKKLTNIPVQDFRNCFEVRYGAGNFVKTERLL